MPGVKDPHHAFVGKVHGNSSRKTKTLEDSDHWNSVGTNPEDEAIPHCKVEKMGKPAVSRENDEDGEE